MSINALARHALILFGLGAVSAAMAGEDPMAAFYGNTVTIDVPAGWYHVERYVDPDGTWREPRDGGEIRGVWRREGDQICSWQTEPALHQPHRYCYAPVARRVGEEWVTTDPQTGNEVIQKIVAGRSR